MRVRVPYGGEDERLCFHGLRETLNGLLRGGHLVCLPPLLGVLQNDTASMIIDDSPFLDFLERSKAAKAIIQAAIPYARGLGGDVDITHWRRPGLRDFEFDHTDEGESGHPSQWR